MEVVVVVEIDEEGEVVTVVEGVTAAAAVVGTVAEVEDMAEAVEEGEVDMVVEGEEVVVMVVGEGAEMASMETLGAR